MSVRLLPPLCLCVLLCLAFIKLLAPAFPLLLGLCQGGAGQISSVFTAENSLPLEFSGLTSRYLSFSLSRPAQHTRSSTLIHLNIILLPMLNANQTAAHTLINEDTALVHSSRRGASHPKDKYSEGINHG